MHLYPLSGTQVSATPIATTTTDAQGRYYFNSAGKDGVQYTADDLGNYGRDGLANTADDQGLPGLKPSNSRIINRYAIRLDDFNDYYPGHPLDNSAPTAPNIDSGANADERDSDAVLANGYAQIIFATGHSGQNNDALDFGFTQPAKLSGRVWVDGDHNGSRAPTDAVITGTRVFARGPGTLLVSAFTDDNGQYAFNALPPGLYTVTFALPSGYTFTHALIGDPALNSDVVRPDGTTYTFTLRSSDDLRNVDAGLWKPRPTIDLQALTNGDDANALTGPVVNYASPITWTYRVTNTGDITLSRILVQDDPVGVIICPFFELAPGATMTCEQPGLAAGGQYTNIVSVWSTDFVTPIPITDTDISHHFGLITPTIQIKKYTNGQSADAPPGLALVNGTVITWTYVVTNAGNVPFNAISIIDDREGPVACQSYALAVGQSLSCFQTGSVINGAYENRATVTANYNVPNVKGNTTASALSHYTGYAPATVGGLVWLDRNLSGVFESGELPLFGVTATLLSVSGNSATPLAAVRTGGDGRYLFKNLLPGNYAVVFSPPVGYRFTPPGLGDPALNSDADPLTGRTPTFALAAGEVNNTLGAGLFTELPRLNVRITVNGQDSDAAPGPLLEVGAALEWAYIIQNTGEITLTQIRVGDDKAGPLVNCNRDFLPPGQLLICNRLGVVTQGPYANTATVSGLIPGTGGGEGGPVSPAAVVTSSAISHYSGGLANLSLRKDSVPLSNTALFTGNLVTYSLSVLNVGTFTATGVVVSDVLPVGLAFVAGSAGISAITGTLATTVTWAVGGLGLNQRRVVVVVAQALGTPPTGRTFANIAYAASGQTQQTRSNLVEHQFKVTATSLTSFSATPQASGTALGMVLAWRTGAEINTFGFRLFRSATSDRSQAMSLGQMIPSSGSNASYKVVDADGRANHFYWLAEVDRDGISTEYGPAHAPSILPALTMPNVAAGGVPVLVPLPISSNATTAASLSPPATQLQQPSVAVQVQPVNIEKAEKAEKAEAAQAELVVEKQVFAQPSLPQTEPPKPKQAQLSILADAPKEVQSLPQSAPSSIQQPAVGAQQSGDAAVQPAPIAHTAPPQQPPSISMGWVVLAGALLMLVVVAGSILGLLVYQLRRGFHHR